MPFCGVSNSVVNHINHLWATLSASLHVPAPYGKRSQVRPFPRSFIALLDSAPVAGTLASIYHTKTYKVIPSDSILSYTSLSASCSTQSLCCFFKSLSSAGHIRDSVSKAMRPLASGYSGVYRPNSMDKALCKGCCTAVRCGLFYTLFKHLLDRLTSEHVPIRFSDQIVSPKLDLIHFLSQVVLTTESDRGF